MTQKRIRKLLMSMGVGRNLVNGIIRETIQDWRETQDSLVLRCNPKTEKWEIFNAPSWEKQYNSLMEEVKS